MTDTQSNKMVNFSAVHIHEILIIFHLFIVIFFQVHYKLIIGQLPVHQHWDHRGQGQILASLKFFQAFFSQLTAYVASVTAGLSLKARDWGFTAASMSIRPGYSCRKQRENISKGTS